MKNLEKLCAGDVSTLLQHFHGNKMTWQTEKRKDLLENTEEQQQ